MTLFFRSQFIFGVGLFLLLGCGHSIDTPFQEARSPSPFVMADRVCKPDGDGVYREAAPEIRESAMKGKHFFAKGGGCVVRSLSSTWKNSQTNAVLAWDRSDLIKVTTDTDPSAYLALLSWYEAGPWPFRQSWKIKWLHTILEGNSREPKRILIKYKKVQGSSYIEYWEGAIELETLQPSVTSMVMYNEIQAAQTGAKESSDAVRDFLIRLRR